ncbi:MAG: hypothetical protein QOF83_1233 [Solirubrobacteraceae bacterium]|jgi:uncharacterized protein YbcI|nr:hypothetical protein [Solirubrobacteraceae bacterium]
MAGRVTSVALGYPALGRGKLTARPPELELRLSGVLTSGDHRVFESKAEPQAVVGDPTPVPTVEISNAISHLHKEFVGRGPTNARTTVDGNLVVCLLEGGYTRAEQTLEDNQHGDVVAAGRLGLQDAMRDAMIRSVERALGREVVSFMSANDLRRNLQVEVFVMTSGADPSIGSRG